MGSRAAGNSQFSLLAVIHLVAFLLHSVMDCLRGLWRELRATCSSRGAFFGRLRAKLAKTGAVLADAAPGDAAAAAGAGRTKDAAAPPSCQSGPGRALAALRPGGARTRLPARPVL